MEPNIRTAEAIAGSPGASEINKTIDTRNQKEKINSTATVKKLEEAEADARIKEMTRDPNIQKSLVDLIKFCDGTLSARESAAFIKHFSKDLSTMQLFQVLQDVKPGRFGVLGGPADSGYIGELMRNPGFVKAVKEKISGVLGGENVNYKEIDDIKDEVDKLRIEKVDKDNEVINNASRILQITSELDQYNREIDPKTKEPIGGYIKQINTIREEISKKQTHLEDLERKRSVLEKYMVTGKIATGVVIEVGGKTYHLTDKASYDSFINGSKYKPFEDLIGAQRSGIAIDEGVIKQLEKNEIDYKEEVKVRKANEKNLKSEADEAGKKLIQKEKELQEKTLQGKTSLIPKSEKQLADSIKGILRETYGEMFTNIYTVAGEWQGEQIKTVEPLVEKQLIQHIADGLILEVGGVKKISEAQLKNIIDGIKSDTAGKGVENYGKINVERYFNDRMTSPIAREYLKTIAEFDARGNIIRVLDKDKFDSLSSSMVSEVLAIQMAKDPSKLQKLFTEDEVLVRAIRGDVFPSLIDKAQKDMKYKKALEVSGLSGLTKENSKGFLEGLDPKKVAIAIAILLAVLFGSKMMSQ